MKIMQMDLDLYFKDDEKYKNVDDYLNRLCTEDSVVLDKEAFKSVHKLITSTDKENVSVGLTMMANCNEENKPSITDKRPPITENKTIL